jgi:hypothetical protein
MSWLFSQALVEASLGESSLGGEPCAPLNVTPTRRPFWHRDKTMDVLTRSPFGLTWKPLTAERGEAVLTWCREDSRAKTSAQPARVRASRGSGADCGARWHALLAKFNPDTCGWKTARCLWEEDLDWSCLTLPRWGSLHDGELWERATPGLPTSETESGSLLFPTPKATEARFGYSSHGGAPSLGKMAKEGWWPTPNKSEGDGGAQPDERRRGHQWRLRDAVAMWPTPRAGNPGSRPNGKGGKILAEEVAIAEGLRERGQKMLPTPCARDYRSGKGKTQAERGRTAGPSLSEWSGGSLNPTWVEWLMGWPLGWTDCADSATDRFRQWLDSHGKRSPVGEQND